MKYAITNKDQLIGITELERSDPPMGFVFGALEPTQWYTLDTDDTDYKIYVYGTDEEIASESIIIEDHSDELGEQCIEVTVLVKSAEIYAKFFQHHLDAYEKQFFNL